MKTKTITINVDPKLHTEFKMAAVKKGTSMTEILLETVKKEVKDAKNDQIKK